MPEVSRNRPIPQLDLIARKHCGTCVPGKVSQFSFQMPRKSGRLFMVFWPKIFRLSPFSVLIISFNFASPRVWQIPVSVFHFRFAFQVRYRL
jgi:hypothetical protein